MKKIRAKERSYFWNFIFLGVLGIKVKIMLPWDPSGRQGPKNSLPDHVSIISPKEDPVVVKIPTQEVALEAPAVAT